MTQTRPRLKFRRRNITGHGKKGIRPHSALKPPRIHKIENPVFVIHHKFVIKPRIHLVLARKKEKIGPANRRKRLARRPTIHVPSQRHQRSSPTIKKNRPPKSLPSSLLHQRRPTHRHASYNVIHNVRLRPSIPRRRN